MRRTVKLVGAVALLGRESLADMDVDEFIERANTREIKPEQVYRAVRHFGYRWDGRSWYRLLPHWLESMIDARNDELLADLEPERRILLKRLEKATRSF